ncbi:MAG: glycosyltransferase, partial [Candidatus Paceibacteria bacterium]
MKVSFLAPDDWTIYNFKMPVIRKIKEEGHDVTIITPYGENVDKFKEEGYEWRRWKLDHHSINPLKEIVSITDLFSIYIKEKPDIAHHYTAKGILYGSIAARFSQTSGIINAVTGGVSALGNVVSEEKWVHRAVKRVLESAYRYCLSGTEVIFQNPDDMESFLDKGIVSERSSHLVNGSGASLGKFTVKEEVGDGNTTVIL